MRRAALRGGAFRVAAVALGLGLALLGLEVVLRLLPVSDATLRTPVDDRNPIIRLAPNRVFTWSRDWNLELVTRVRTNNYGFINDVDYRREGPRPLIAVVGDSYVEALMVRYAETGAGRLAAYLGDAGRVYTFALSGAPLSQYLAYAAFARDNFAPDAFIFVIVSNDFDRSLLTDRSMRGMHYFEDRGGELVLRRVDFDVSLPKRMARTSALFRYLMINLDLYHLPKNLRRRFAREQAGSGGPPSRTPTPAAAARLGGSKRAVDAFVERLPTATGVSPARIALVLDGMRPELYDDVALAEARGSFHDLMRRELSLSGRAAGYRVIDMHPVFVEHYGRFGRRFEFATDAHWNPLAHELFFESLIAGGFLQNVR